MKKQKIEQFNHTKIEKQVQKKWDSEKIYKTENKSTKKPFYVLDMFPYPSGSGLHVGHPRGYIGSDVYARFKRMQGYNVLHPMGFDAFGLPAEQYAMTTGKHPSIITNQAIKRYKKQLEQIGFSYDWDREVQTIDPEYYKWTQWIFLQIYNSWFDTKKQKARPISDLVAIFEREGNSKVDDYSVHSEIAIFSKTDWKNYSLKERQDVLMKYRLAYEGYAEVNWCKDLGTVLANDEVLEKDGKLVSERGEYPVERKSMRQWFMRITAYADRLLAGLETVDYLDSTKEAQRNWIGKSTGSEIDFKTNINRTIKVFTTRADTLLGVTYVVLSPEHPHIGEFLVQAKNMAEVSKYVREAKERANKDTQEDKQKTGIVLEGIYAINPANGEQVPVWVADYVLASYGTGAVMAVPAHDERDFEFAQKYNLPIKQVVAPYIYLTGTETPRSNDNIVKINCATAILKHWDEDKYYVIKFNNAYGFIGGKMEVGEINKEETIKREILEESGYKNIKSIKTIFEHAYGRGFKSRKQVEDEGHDQVFYVELADSERTYILDKHTKEGLWLTKEEILKLDNLFDHHKFYFESFIKTKIFIDYGVLVNSNQFDGLTSEEAKEKITEFVGGKIVTKYKMRDAIFARQRYWGEPIPLIHDKKTGLIKEVPVSKLPLKLPNVKSYTPTGNGESPLASVKSWVDQGYETNTMPGWAGSSWYFLRYMDPKNKKALVGDKAVEYFKNVDMYVGGTEHNTGHLLYARFWHKFLFDIGVAKTEEPFKALRHQGMIGGTDGRKMSKRWGNVINPDDVVQTYGADTLRLFEMFLGPFEAHLPWSEDGIIGSRRFIDRVWRVSTKVENSRTVHADPGYQSFEKILHKTIKKVTEDIESFALNTAVSSMMICLNEMEKLEKIRVSDFEKFLQILSPFAPYVTDALWALSNQKHSVHISKWPKYDTNKTIDTEITIGVQINGKTRGEITIPVDASEQVVLDTVHADQALSKYIETPIKKVIYIPGKILNIII